MKPILHRLCIVFIIAVIPVFFYRVFSGAIPVPSDALIGLYHPWRDHYSGQFPRGMPFRNFLITDPVRQQIPWRKTAVDAWRDGSVSGWNPYSGAGRPMLGNIQAGSWYPLNLIFLLFDFPAAWTVLIIMQPVISLVGMFLFLRGQGLGQVASLYGGVTYAFSGFAVSWMTWGTIIHTVSWLPWILYATDQAFKAKKRSSLVYSSGIVFVTVFCTVTAGHIQMAFYALFGAVSYAIWLYGFRKQNSRSILAILIAYLSAGTVTLIQIIPMVISAFDSVRSNSANLYLTEGWFIPAQQLLQFLVPDFFGNPATMNYWGVWNYGEFIGYIGPVSIVLALTASLLKTRNIRFFQILLLVSLILSTANPVTTILARLQLPQVSAMQPSRLMFLMVFSLSVISAYGYHSLDRYALSSFLKSVITVFGIFIILWIFVLAVPQVFPDQLRNDQLGIAARNLILPTAVFILTGFLALITAFLPKDTLRYAVIPYIFLTIVTADLFRAGWKFIPFTEFRDFYPETTSIRFLKNQTVPFRIASFDKSLFPPNTPEFYSLESIDLYDPIYGDRYFRYMSAANTGSLTITEPEFQRIITAENPESPLLNYANVKYFATLEELQNPKFRLVFSEGQTKIYENTHVYPRMYLAQTIEAAVNPDSALEMLMENSGPLFAVVENTLPDGYVLGNADSEEYVRLKAYRFGEAEAETNTSESRLLVFLTAYDKSWRAEIDNHDAPIMRVNYLFQGILVPEGRHNVRFRYDNLILGRITVKQR